MPHRPGCKLVDIQLEEARERQDIFPIVLAVELLATLGRERFERHRAELDPLVEARIARGADVPAVDYFRFVRRHHEIVRIVQARMRDLDAWVAPTVAIVPRPVGDLSDVAQGLKLTAGLTQNSQPVNLFGQCGVTLPIHQSGSELPVGLQLASAPFAEHVALGAALAIEEAMGAAKMPDLDPFFAAPRA